MDCSPGIISGKHNLNELILKNIDYLITPIKSDLASYTGVKILIDSIIKIKPQNPTLEFLGLVLLNVNPRGVLFKKMVESLKDNCFKTIIRTNQEIPKAEFLGKTIFQYNPNCTGSWDFKKFGEEVLNKIK